MLDKRTVDLFKKESEKKALKHKLFCLRMQREYLSLTVTHNVVYNDIIQAKRLARIFKIINSKYSDTIIELAKY